MTERNEGRRNWTTDRAVCNTATEGLDIDTPYDGRHVVFTHYMYVDGRGTVAIHDREADAIFHVEARTGWPAALTEIERLTADIQRYRQALESITEYAGPLTGEDAREMRGIAEGVLADDEAAT